MFNPIDIMDKDLYYKTPVINKLLSGYLATYGKDCTYYINPNFEGSENETIDTEQKNNTDLVNNADSRKRTANYTLAYGKDMVGYDYSKMPSIQGKLYAEYKDYYVHDIGADTDTMFYLQVKNVKVSRGDIISYKIQNKTIFYRITEKVASYMEMIYRISCKLIEAKQSDSGVKPYDLHNYYPPDYITTLEHGIVL